MIVRLVDDRVALITQPDHARLAGTIMQHCVPLASRPRRDTILHAIAEHDGGWIEDDAAPTINPTTGGIVDFVNAPLSVRQGVWPRGISRLAAVDPYLGGIRLTCRDDSRPEAVLGRFPPR